MPAIPFCVLEKPYMVWSQDVRGDNEHFLSRIDAGLYYRTAHNLIGTGKSSEDKTESETSEEGDDQERKDISSLSRLLWHHGMETLVMALGAYIQTPSAAHAYFLKCKTEDAVEIGGYLLREECPKYHRLSGAPFSLLALLNGINRCAGWGDDHDVLVGRLTDALRNMLHDYVDEKHRAEYNSIKHGLRASHGTFGIAFGIQETPGIPAPPEAMEMIGSSRDASFFDVAKPLKNATKQESKVNFLTETVSVSWSLERVLMELQLLTLLLHNTVSALRIAVGIDAKTVTFHKFPANAEFWTEYSKISESAVTSAAFAPVIDARSVKLATAETVFTSYGAVPGP